MVTKTKRPAMTAEQATHFDRISPANMIILRACLRCDCSPYQDVFTYNRWKAQGYQVRRGEKSIKLPLVKDIVTEDEESETVTTHRILGASFVFCRCQVDKNNKEGG